MGRADRKVSAPMQRRYFALNDLDKQIEKYLDFDNGIFFEAGASDGANQSNTLYFERYRGWTGVLVEPIPHRFLECRELRGGKSQCFWSALVPPDWPNPFVELKYCDLMTVTLSERTALDTASHVARGIQFLKQDERPHRIFAPARTISSILTEAQVNRIDLFSLDIEGFEVAALEGLDLLQFDIRHFCIECRDVDRVQAALGDAYQIVKQLSVHDYLFAKRGNL